MVYVWGAIMRFMFYGLSSLIYFFSQQSFAYNRVQFRPVQKKSYDLYASLDHVSFYNDQVQSFSFLSLSPKVKTRHFSFDAEFLLPVDGKHDFSFSVAELYKSYSIYKSVFYFGRKLHRWSLSESYLPAGFWSNVWDFHKADPTLEGNLGFFLDSRLNKKLSLSLFASPVALPKLTTHQDFLKTGVIDAKSPWFRPPPSQIDYAGSSLPVRYSLNSLDYGDLLLNPQAGLSLFSENKDFDFLFSYLYAPSKDLDTVVDFGVEVSSPSTPVEVSLSAEEAYFHKLSLGFSYKISKNSNLNLSYDHQERVTDLGQSSQASFIGQSSGGIFSIIHNFKVQNYDLGWFAIENTQIESISNGELDLVLKDSLESVFRYQRGAGVFAQVESRKARAKASLFYDSYNQGVLGKLQASWSLLDQFKIELGYQFIEALNSKSKGFYKSFRQKDYVYAGVAYVL